MRAEHNPIRRAQKRCTYLNAIKAMCAYCMGCDENYLEPGFRQSISDCSSKDCPLHPFRPYRTEKLIIPSERGGVLTEL